MNNDITKPCRRCKVQPIHDPAAHTIICPKCGLKITATGKRPVREIWNNAQMSELTEFTPAQRYKYTNDLFGEAMADPDALSTDAIMEQYDPAGGYHSPYDAGLFPSQRF